ncbi:MAG: TolC family protein [Pyrinomonadaceae bacterium]
MKLTVFHVFRIALCFAIFGLFSLNVWAQESNNEIAKLQPEGDLKQTGQLDAPTNADSNKVVETSSEISSNELSPNETTKSLGKRVGVFPGQTRSLTLDQAIRLALENNNSIEMARSDVLIAESGLRAAEGLYDPTFTFNPNYTRNAQPQPSTLGGADTSGVTRSNSFKFDTTFTQPVKQGGGQFNVFFNNNRNDTSSTFSTLNPTYNTTLGFGFVQPIFRNMKIDQTRRQINIQRKIIGQSDADFRRQAIETVSQVQNAYWDLVFALRDQQNKVANLNLSKENLRQVDAKIAAGAAAPLQRAEVSTELANRESEVLVASQSVSTAENNLKQLIYRDSNAPGWSDSLLPTDQPAISANSIDLTAVTNDAITNRPELARLRLQRDINEIDIEFYKNQIKPQVDLNVNYSLIGLAGSSTQTGSTTTIPLISGNPATNADAFLLSELQNLNPAITVPTLTVTTTNGVPDKFIGGYGRSLSNLFSNDTNSFSIGATISFPLRNRTAKANLATAQYQQDRLAAQMRSQEQTVIVEVRNAVQAVETARQRVTAAQSARVNAEIQLEGERKLYNSGRSTTFLLFQRENALTNARNAEIRAETDYNKALADLQKATSTTISANNIVIAPPTIDDGN